MKFYNEILYYICNILINFKKEKYISIINELYNSIVLQL